MASNVHRGVKRPKSARSGRRPSPRFTSLLKSILRGGTGKSDEEAARPECMHAVSESKRTYCTNPDVREDWGFGDGMKCVGTRCGSSDIQEVTDDEEKGGKRRQLASGYKRGRGLFG